MMYEGLTAIVPTCNRPEHLARCLRGLACQRVALARVIVVNDGGIDIASVLESTARRLSVTVLHTARQGPTAARNAALEYVETAHVGFLDDDSAPQAGWAEACLDLFRRFPDVTAQLGRLVWDPPGKTPPWRTFLPRYRQKLYDSRHQRYTDRRFLAALRQTLHRPVPDELPGVSTHLSGGNSALRMNFVRRHGRFDPRFRTFSDREMAWRILDRGGLIAYNPDMIVGHDHDPSLMRALRRAYASAPYEKLLAVIYPQPAWEPTTQSASQPPLTPIQIDLTLAERGFQRLFRVIRWWGHRRAQPTDDPLRSRSRDG